jgi:periplasmic protein TonB
MATLHSNYAYQSQSNHRFKGFVLVAGLHIILVYGLMAGLHRDIARLVAPPMSMVHVPVVELPPPPDLPKPIVKTPNFRTPDVAPTERIIRPDINTVQTNADAVQIEAGIPQTPVVDIPVVGNIPQTPPAVVSMGAACPHMVAPEMPRKAVAEGTTGLVRATVRIKGGVVAEVSQLSGPRIFYSAVKIAMLQYRCTVTPGEVTATQEFNFVLND